MAYEQEEWVPITGLGKKVMAGDFASFDEILASGYPIKEAGIVDAMLPDLVDPVGDGEPPEQRTDCDGKIAGNVLEDSLLT